MCVQQDVTNSQDPSKVIGSEDCLFVNVWTPKERSTETLLPVLLRWTSEVALLASPGAAGLFHRAILMSASVVYNKSWEDATNDNKIFVNNSNCARSSSMAERECLYKLNRSQIEAAIPWDVYPYWRMADLMGLPTKNWFDGAVAVVDKTVVSDPPLVAMATGKAMMYPLL
ncbi:hypothetical protein OS493_022257 [Desmophyllum pertusum]|uniref:Carboxylesterase type B domain-containing protein n=1 Tax=Desmophyllum pertusum TaxID=174260 RepID=A0A9W9YAT0_9CNID|nr:hypothetical protein OS493_022257 [Desmophyllum pertusum]